jgi:hypothetical protein
MPQPGSIMASAAGDLAPSNEETALGQEEVRGHCSLFVCAGSEHQHRGGTPSVPNP